MKPWQLEVFSVSIRKKEKWHWVEPNLRPHLTAESRCLDIGSGVGTLSVLMERLGGRWEFTETDRAAAAETRKLVHGPVHQVNIYHSDLSPGTYDLITAFDVLEHIPDPTSFMRRAAQLLVPGGIILLTTPADDGGFYFWRRLAERVFGIDKEAHGHVVEGFSRTGIEQLCQATALTMVSCQPFSFSFTELVELAYNGAYILKNRAKQRTAGYNLALSPASGHDVSRHQAQLTVLKFAYPLLRGVSLLDRLIPFTRGYEWGVVARSN